MQGCNWIYQQQADIYGFVSNMQFMILPKNENTTNPIDMYQLVQRSLQSTFTNVETILRTCRLSVGL